MEAPALTQQKTAITSAQFLPFSFFCQSLVNLFSLLIFPLSKNTSRNSPSFRFSEKWDFSKYYISFFFLILQDCMYSLETRKTEREKRRECPLHEEESHHLCSVSQSCWELGLTCARHLQDSNYSQPSGSQFL